LFSSMRLSQYISRCGVCSRREAEKYILDGSITVNSEKVIELGTRVEELKDVIKLKGKVLEVPRSTVVFMMNKVKGEIVADKDPDSRKSVFDRLVRLGLSPQLRSIVLFSTI